MQQLRMTCEKLGAPTKIVLRGSEDGAHWLLPPALDAWTRNKSYGFGAKGAHHEKRREPTQQPSARALGHPHARTSQRRFPSAPLAPKPELRSPTFATTPVGAAEELAMVQ